MTGTDLSLFENAPRARFSTCVTAVFAGKAWLA